MASKKTLSLAFFLSLNLLFFLLVSAWTDCPPPGSKPKPKPKHRPRPKPKPRPQPTPSPCPCPPPPSGHPPSRPPPSGPSPSGPPPSCPRDALKLGVCADLLKGLLNITIGTPPVTPCCSLIQGLADLEAALCLCTAIKGNLLGLNLNIPLSLSLLLNVCSKKVPPQFQCP